MPSMHQIRKAHDSLSPLALGTAPEKGTKPYSVVAKILIKGITNHTL
jgi:hypothetical protein